MKVLILSGSKSDADYVKRVESVLDDFDVKFDSIVSSAHRQPEKTQEIAKKAEADGYGVIIALAGFAAALPGFAASHSNLPVIGVPLPGSDLNGVDAMLAILQMPGGVPTVSTGIGSAGAKNAALQAVRILALCDDKLKKKLQDYKTKLAEG